MAKKKSLAPAYVLAALAGAGFWYASWRNRFNDPSIAVFPVGGWIFVWKGNTPLLGLPEGIRIAKPIKPGGLYAYSVMVESPILILVKPGVRIDDVADEARKFNENNPQT